MKKAKKITAIILSTILVICAFTGCSNNSKVDVSKAEELSVSDWNSFGYLSSANSRIGRVYKVSTRISKIEEDYFVTDCAIINGSYNSYQAGMKMQVFLSAKELKELHGGDAVDFVGEITDIQGEQIDYMGVPMTEVNVIFGNATVVNE